MLAEIKSLRDGAKPLTDIPAMLRELADMFERGDYPGTDEVIVIRSVPNLYPVLHGYGLTSLDSTIRLLSCAQASLVGMICNGKGPVSR